jgi:hypothetical protein
MQTLTRYWFTFAKLAIPTPLKLGCGVTAFSHEDAVEILKNTVFLGRSMPHIENMIENVDVSTLDQGHVIPNMLPPNIRGVWFPKEFA